MKTQSSFWISCPGKTFLAGEYAALAGGPCLLISTRPRFTFSAEVQNLDLSSSFRLKSFPSFFPVLTEEKPKNLMFSSLLNSMHKNAPVSQWVSRYPEVYRCFSLKVYDPYKGRGGFGFSSACFLFVYLLHYTYMQYTQKSGLQKKPSTPLFWETDEGSKKDFAYCMWKHYRSLSFPVLPSGADLMSQLLGRVSVFGFSPFTAKPLDWAFQDLDFFLISTGITFPTWKHLNQLSIGKDLLNKLKKLSGQCVHSYLDRDRENFLDRMSRFGNLLEREQYVHPQVVKQLKTLRSIKKVLFAKACGAYGAEVICLFFHPQNKEGIEKKVKKAYTIIASSKDLSNGACFHWFK